MMTETVPCARMQPPSPIAATQPSPTIASAAAPKPTISATHAPLRLGRYGHAAAYTIISYGAKGISAVLFSFLFFSLPILPWRQEAASILSRWQANGTVGRVWLWHSPKGNLRAHPVALF